MSLRLLIANRRLARLATRAAALLLTVGVSAPAFAQSMVGSRLLDFAANYIIGPLGIFAVVVALAGSIFRPDLARSAIYAAIICAVLFFIIKSAPSLIGAFQN
jgi:hypothetical protein